MFFTKKGGLAKISVCIPVYHTEEFLLSCLDSVANQTFSDYEIILVDDGSNNPATKKIIHDFKKGKKIPLEFIQHQENKGLVEARRTAVYAARGEFITILDSDDLLLPDALENLWQKQVESGADIVHGKADVFFWGENSGQSGQSDQEKQKNQRLADAILKKVNDVYQGQLFASEDENQILDGFLLPDSPYHHMGYLWGKLIRRETYLEALSHIPPIWCTRNEELLQYIYIAKSAKKYVGFDSKVYKYAIDSGITSHAQIKDLAQWEKVCSVSGVFVTLFTQYQEDPSLFTQVQYKSLLAKCRFHLENNFSQLKAVVLPQLQAEAFDILCDYWGKDLVGKVIGENPFRGK